MTFTPDLPFDSRSPRGSVAVIAVTLFLNVAGFTLILPVIPALVGRYVPPAQIGFYVGLIVSVFALCAFVSAPVLGALSDRVGRRPILLVSLVGSAVGYTIFGIGGALWVLFLGRVVDGLTAGNISAIFAYVADTQPPDRRGQVFGLLGAITGLAFMFGPVMGGLLGAWSPDAPLFVAALVTLAAALWVHAVLPESIARQQPRSVWRWRQLDPFAHLAHALAYREVRGPFLAAFSFFFAGAILQSNVTVYLGDVLHFGPFAIGLSLFGVGVMDIFSQGVLSRILLPRFGAKVLARIGLAINAAGFCMMACLVIVPTVGFLVASIAVFTLGDGLFQPAMNETIANAAPAEAQGAIQGANQAQQALARMLGPLIPTCLTPIGSDLPYWAGAAIAFCGAVFLSIRGPGRSQCAS